MSAIKYVTASLIGLTFASTMAMAAPEPVEEAVARVASQYGINNALDNASIYPESGGAEGGDTDEQGYIAWVPTPGPAPGYLVIQTGTSGYVKQVYTRFGANISGVPAF